MIVTHGERVLITEEVPERQPQKLSKGWKLFGEFEAMPRPRFRTKDAPILVFGIEAYGNMEAYELAYWRDDDGDKPYWCDTAGDSIEHEGWLILAYYVFPECFRDLTTGEINRKKRKGE
jgi:hypothetical protein